MGNGRYRCAEGRRGSGAARKMVDRVNIFEGRRCEKLYFEVKKNEKNCEGGSAGWRIGC